MAFEWRGGDPPYTEFETYTDDGSLSLKYYVGLDQEKGAVYFVALEFSPYLDNAPEFSFCIVERLTSSDRENLYYSGRNTVGIFPDETRSMILDVIVGGIAELLRLEKPETIYRATADYYPPEPAMEKHRRIGEAFKQHGYNVWACDSHHGQQVWFMTRLSEQAYHQWRAIIEADDEP